MHGVNHNIKEDKKILQNLTGSMIDLREVRFHLIRISDILELECMFLLHNE